MYPAFLFRPSIYCTQSVNVGAVRTSSELNGRTLGGRTTQKKHPPPIRVGIANTAKYT